jgi:hypothetical protein
MWSATIGWNSNALLSNEWIVGREYYDDSRMNISSVLVCLMICLACQESTLTSIRIRYSIAIESITYILLLSSVFL